MPDAQSESDQPQSAEEPSRSDGAPQAVTPRERNRGLWQTGRLALGGGVVFFTDSNAFDAALAEAGKVFKADEDFEEANLEPNSVGIMDDPLDANTDNGFFSPGDIPGNLGFQSNLDAPGLFGPNPAGVDGLAVLTTGFFGVVNNAVGANLFANSMDIMSFNPSHTALSIEIVELLGEPGGPIEVYVFDLNDILIGEMIVANANPDPAFVGMLVTGGGIGRVNLHAPNAGAEVLYAMTAYISVGDECGNGVCEDSENCESCPGDCGPCSNCGCGLDTNGESFCAEPASCSDVVACTSNADCGSGERCLANNCCDPPFNFSCAVECPEGCVDGGTCETGYELCALDVCDDCIDGGVDTCNGSPTCHDCVTPEGDCPCVEAGTCSELITCPNGSDDCPAGSFCCLDTCCTEPVCLTPCGPQCLTQPPNQVNGFFSDIDGDPLFIQAENFILNAEEGIDTLTFWGGYFPGNIPQNPDCFTVIFREVDPTNGLPGAEINRLECIEIPRVATGVILFDVDEYEYTLDLVPNKILGPGTFWVEIYNDTVGNPDQWFWETGDLDPELGIPGFAFATTLPEPPWTPNAAGDLSLDIVCKSEPAEPVGACCDKDGTCSDNVTEETCASVEGVWNPNASCDDPGFFCNVGCSFDNGPPSEDRGSLFPVAQLDVTFPFVAATVDDFYLNDQGDNNCGIDTITTWVGHFGELAAASSPDDYDGVWVTVYRNLVDGKGPAGKPFVDDQGTFGHEGDTVYTRFVADFEWNEVALPCFNDDPSGFGGPTFKLSLPVDGLNLEKKTKYWLEIIPQVSFVERQYQTVLMFSEVNQMHVSQMGFPAGNIEYWDGRPANAGVCPPDTPPADSLLGIAFVLSGQKQVGACCAADGTCAEVPESDCAGFFWGDGTNCDDVICTGACCFTANACADMSEQDCVNAGEDFQGIGTECPTQNTSTAVHNSTQVVHWSDPAINCFDIGNGPEAGGCMGGDAGDTKIDPWVTSEGANTCHVFGVEGSPPIPADFFAPGSDPFVGAICFQGEPLGDTQWGSYGTADTLVMRTIDPFDRCELASATERTVQIEIVALNLVSGEPITVTFNGGQNPEQWDVRVDLSVVSPPPGSLTAVKTHCNGGTYNSILTVQPRLTFNQVSDPNQMRILDTGLEGLDPVLLVQDDNPPWVSDVDPNLIIETPWCTDFHPGVEDAELVTECDCTESGQRDICDIEDGSAEDCNENLIPDSCDIDSGFSSDDNGNGVPDECEPPTILHGEGLPGETQPFTGYVDPRKNITAFGDPGDPTPVGLTQATIRFNEPVLNCGGGPLTVGNIQLTETGGGAPPAVLGVSPVGADGILVEWNRPITLLEWTTIRVANGCNGAGIPLLDLGDLGPDVAEPDRVDIAFLPADVDQNSDVTPFDLLAFRSQINACNPNCGPETLQFLDIDRNGAISPFDLLVFRQGINGSPPLPPGGDWDSLSMQNTQP